MSEINPTDHKSITARHIPRNNTLVEADFSIWRDYEHRFVFHNESLAGKRRSSPSSCCLQGIRFPCAESLPRLVQPPLSPLPGQAEPFHAVQTPAEQRLLVQASTNFVLGLVTDIKDLTTDGVSLSFFLAFKINFWKRVPRSVCCWTTSLTQIGGRTCWAWPCRGWPDTNASTTRTTYDESGREGGCSKSDHLPSQTSPANRPTSFQHHPCRRDEGVLDWGRGRAQLRSDWGK